MMGIRYQRISVKHITSTADALRASAENLAKVAMDMQASGMNDALFTWTQNQWKSLEAVITLCSQCVIVLPAQILAKQQGRLSTFEITKEKSQRDVESRRKREKKSPDPKKPPRKRGRPRKNLDKPDDQA